MIPKNGKNFKIKFKDNFKALITLNQMYIKRINYIFILIKKYEGILKIDYLTNVNTDISYKINEYVAKYQ